MKLKGAWCWSLQSYYYLASYVDGPWVYLSVMYVHLNKFASISGVFRLFVLFHFASLTRSPPHIHFLILPRCLLASPVNTGTEI